MNELYGERDKWMGVKQCCCFGVRKVGDKWCIRRALLTGGELNKIAFDCVVLVFVNSWFVMFFRCSTMPALTTCNEDEGDEAVVLLMAMHEEIDDELCGFRLHIAAIVFVDRNVLRIRRRSGVSSTLTTDGHPPLSFPISSASSEEEDEQQGTTIGRKITDGDDKSGMRKSIYIC